MQTKNSFSRSIQWIQCRPQARSTREPVSRRDASRDETDSVGFHVFGVEQMSYKIYASVFILQSGYICKRYTLNFNFWKSEELKGM